MFNRVFTWLWQLFGKVKRDTSDNAEKNSSFGEKYRSVDRINFTSIFANKLSIISSYDSAISIIGDNARADILSKARDRFVEKIKKITSTALGTGSALVVPYIQNGELYFNVVSQDRIYINETQGDRLTDVFVLSDTKELNYTKFYKWVNYTLFDNTVLIRTKVTDVAGKIVRLPEWEEDDKQIQGCDRLLFGFLKSPVDNRSDSDAYGVPITYGCDETITQIYECMSQIQEEYRLKRTKVFADSRFFRRDERTGQPKITSDVFMTLESAGTDELMQPFSPDIRDSSYYNRLNALYEQLEKEIGTSRGILTKRDSGVTTATEIRASQMDTSAIVDMIRKNIEHCFNDYIYACDVLLNAYSKTPRGDYEVDFDWSNAWLTDSGEEWNQIRTARADGAISTAEMRAWLKNEPLEVAEEAVAKIKEEEPNFNQLIGG